MEMENLSYIHNIGSEPLKYLSLGQLLKIAATKYGHVVAVDSVEQKCRLTYMEMLTEADKFASGLTNLGMKKGDRLGLWAYNCIEWYIVNWACMRGGFIMVPLNTASIPSELEYVINKTAIKIIVCPYESKRINFCDTLLKIAPELRNAKEKGVQGMNIPCLKEIIVMSETQTVFAHNYKDIIEIGKRSHTKNTDTHIDPDDLCYIHLTSGTTGKPKAIALSHLQVLNRSYDIAKRLDLNHKQHSICVQVPLFHTFGTVATISATAHFGTTSVLPSMLYNPMLNFDAINKKKCSIICGTPTMYVDLISIQEETQKALNVDCAVIGAAPNSPELIKKMKGLLNIKAVKLMYGLTETSTSVFMSEPGDRQEIDTVGYICDHLEVKLVDENGRTVPLGAPGEIYVRGYSVMRGYWNDEDSTKKVLSGDGWFKTGDIGKLQSNGYAKILGRATDLIIRGGENIYPKEIEDILCTHQHILEAQIIGTPHERLGEEVCACLIMKNGFTVSIAEVSEFCKSKISYYKIPTQLKLMQDFPKTPSGKVQKGLLRKYVCKALESNRAMIATDFSHHSNSM